MTFPPHADLDRLAAAVEALRALEAGAGAGGCEAAGCGAGVGRRAGVNAGGVDPAFPAGQALTTAQELVRSLAVLGAVRAAVDAVALHRIAVLERERGPGSGGRSGAGGRAPECRVAAGRTVEDAAAGRPPVVCSSPRDRAPAHAAG